jgi:G:T/U-mismatch repair DNA glycosylase
VASNGFALWDVLGSCERKGSLNNDIKKEQPNPLCEFCQDHPTIIRIIMTGGAKQCELVLKQILCGVVAIWRPETRKQ